MTNEKLTIQTSADLFSFIQGVESADFHARQNAYFNEQAKLAITALKAQYVDVQALNDNTPVKVGVLPKEITRAVISQLWDAKKVDMLKEDVKPTEDNLAQQQENHRDHWFKVVKAGILYGMPHTQSIKNLQEGLIKQHDTLMKKLASEKAKAEKAEKAEKEAQEKAAQKAQEAQEAQEAQDFDAMIEAAQKGKEAQVQAQEAQAQAQEAQEMVTTTEKALEKVEKKIETTQKQADKKARAASPPATLTKADNNLSNPKLDFKVLNFSQDCKDIASMLLTDLEKDCSAPELLYLAKLILDKYNK
jgi:chromosome segregation ATPase